MKNFWEKIKNWSNAKLLPWLKKQWMIIINSIVLIILYIALPEESVLGALVGFWIFVQVAFLGWKLFTKTSPTPVKIEYVDRVIEKIVEKPVEVIKYIEKPAVKKTTKPKK